MNQNKLSCRELFAAVGVTTNSSGNEIPVEHRHLLIASVLECISAQKLRQVLSKHGVKVTLRNVSEWQAKTRDWLGLPPARPGKPSTEYLRAIQLWREANGNPTWEEIDSGWVPAHHRETKCNGSKQLSPSFQRLIDEFRREVEALNATEDVEEHKRLLTQFMEEMGNAWQIPLLATEPQQSDD